jgi:hypothetical protein
MAGEGKELPIEVTETVTRIALSVGRQVLEQCVIREGGHVLIMAFRCTNKKGICVGGATMQRWEELIENPEDCQAVMKRMDEMLAAGDMESYGKAAES